MARTRKSFVCQSCGSVFPKWAGQCEACGEWNTIVEEVVADVPKGLARAGGGRGRHIALTDLGGVPGDAPRLRTGISEFDRACGGGLVSGSAILVGGDPGIGKSTILLQATSRLAAAGVNTVYISGEEATAQVQMRAGRLGLDKAPVRPGTETNLRDILATLEADSDIQAVVIDSIQTMFVDNIESAPGTVAQVRATAHELIRFAKKRGVVLILVGHVTKDGQIAGPRVLEHMVDTVLYFEGERGHQ
ncbi:MAG: ATPase domain-containing protein, partial [Sphingomonadales bacterium]